MQTLLHFHIMFCTMACTLVKELTQSLVASHNKPAIKFVENITYFASHNDTLAHL